MSGKRLHIRLLGLALLLVVSGKFTACEPEDWMLTVDCQDCYSYKPDSADLIVYLSIDALNDSVPLTFYRGSYEEGVIDWQDTATTEEFFLYSEMDRTYTVKATYRSGDQTIIAFDSDKMHIYNGSAECGSPCYVVKGGIFEVQLIE